MGDAGKEKHCLPSQTRGQVASCSPCWALNCPADVHVWNPRHSHSLSSGQGRREAKELPKSHKFTKKRFPSGRTHQRFSCHGVRSSFRATASLLCHQHMNISHEYSGTTMKWLLLKSWAMFKCYPTKGRAVKPPLFAAGLHGFWRWARAAAGACLSRACRIRHLQTVLLISHFRIS